jgi:hypothetical protein
MAWRPCERHGYRDLDSRMTCKRTVALQITVSIHVLLSDIRIPISNNRQSGQTCSPTRAADAGGKTPDSHARASTEYPEIDFGDMEWADFFVDGVVFDVTKANSIKEGDWKF